MTIWPSLMQWVATRKNIYDQYEGEYGVKPIFILKKNVFGSS